MLIGPSTRWNTYKTAFLLIAALLVFGCEEAESINPFARSLTPHEAYTASLEQAGLIETALGRSWLTASTTFMEAASPVSMPFREVRYLDPAQPTTASYRFDLRRGQKLMIDVAPQPNDTVQVFIDLYEAPRDSTKAPRRLRSADSTRTIVYNIRRSRTYLLRVQPELLYGGRFQITIQTEASLAFPVADKDTGAIRSFFGDSRDGGRRRHHGVDIFADKGTPALAAAEGTITRVRNGGLGGKVVWLRDRRGHALYYAHLDTQLVTRGMRVSIGDTLGLVGNTGNARTTPPHLHFGIYQDGPTDPFPFLEKPRTKPSDIRVDTSRLGHTVRVARTDTRLRTAPGRRADVVRDLPRHTALYVTGGSGSWYRVHLPDGAMGYVAATQLEPAQQAVREVRLAQGRALHRNPASSALPIDSLAANATVPVLGEFDAFLYVETPTGRTGWIAAE